MFSGPVGPVDVGFYRPKAILRISYWPGASAALLLLNPAKTYFTKVILQNI